MEEIGVGEYCRTYDGIIGIKIEYNNGLKLKIDKDEYYKPLVDSIVKHSKNIIDLIEVGDIVNKGYIYETGNAENGDRWVHNLNGLILYNQDIKTILTHEQFENNVYRIGV